MHSSQLQSAYLAFKCDFGSLTVWHLGGGARLLPASGPLVSGAAAPVASFVPIKVHRSSSTRPYDVTVQEPRAGRPQAPAVPAVSAAITTARGTYGFLDIEEGSIYRSGARLSVEIAPCADKGKTPNGSFYCAAKNTWTGQYCPKGRVSLSGDEGTSLTRYRCSERS